MDLFPDHQQLILPLLLGLGPIVSSFLGSIVRYPKKSSPIFCSSPLFTGFRKILGLVSLVKIAFRFFNSDTNSCLYSKNQTMLVLITQKFKYVQEKLSNYKPYFQLFLWCPPTTSTIKPTIKRILNMFCLWNYMVLFFHVRDYVFFFFFIN